MGVRWSPPDGHCGSEQGWRRQLARECRGAERSDATNGIQMVGAGVPGSEVRAAHHTQSPPPCNGGRLCSVWLPLPALAPLAPKYFSLLELRRNMYKTRKKKPCRVAGADLTMPFGQEGLDLHVCRSQDVPRTIPSYTGLQQSAFWGCLRLQKAQPLLLNSYKHQHRGRVSLFNVVSYLDITGFSFF